MKFKKYLSILIPIILLVMPGCDDDTITINSTGEVIVINEGNFTDSDGSLSTIDVGTGQVINNAFNNVNGRPIGGIVQNVVLFDGQLFILTNTADKLEAINATTLESIGTISTGLASPFSFAANGNKGYVSNWGVFNLNTFLYEESFIAVIDLSSFEIIKKVVLDVQPQHLLAVGSVILIAKVGGSTVSVLSTDTDVIIRDITVPQRPDNMVSDGNGNIWVICSSGYLVKLDPSLTFVETEIPNVPVNGFNENIAIDHTGSNIYILAITGFMPSTGAIFRISLNENQVFPSPLPALDNIYGLGIDPFDGTIYLGDNNAFQGNGTVITYDATGNLQGTFAVGRAPSGFVFR